MIELKDGNLFKMVIVIQVSLVILGLFISIWVAPSAMISAVKSVSDDCGKTYPIEKIFDGNFFCAEEDQ